MRLTVENDKRCEPIAFGRRRHIDIKKEDEMP
jgi:hypothetical protein